MLEWDGTAFFFLCLVGLDKDWAWAFWVMIYPALSCLFLRDLFRWPGSYISNVEGCFESLDSSHNLSPVKTKKKGGGTGR